MPASIGPEERRGGPFDVPLRDFKSDGSIGTVSDARAQGRALCRLTSRQSFRCRDVYAASTRPEESPALTAGAASVRVSAPLSQACREWLLGAVHSWHTGRDEHQVACAHVALRLAHTHAALPPNDAHRPAGAWLCMGWAAPGSTSIHVTAGSLPAASSACTSAADLTPIAFPDRGTADACGELFPSLRLPALVPLAARCSSLASVPAGVRCDEEAGQHAHRYSADSGDGSHDLAAGKEHRAKNRDDIQRAQRGTNPRLRRHDGPPRLAMR